MWNIEDKSQGLEIKGYLNNNGIFNTSEFIEELFKNQKKTRFTGAGASHQNGTAERAIKVLVTMERTMLIHDALICTDETLYISFGQYQWNMLYGYIVVSMICSKFYKLL